jgi:superfamily II RNA helicase
MASKKRKTTNKKKKPSKKASRKSAAPRRAKKASRKKAAPPRRPRDEESRIEEPEVIDMVMPRRPDRDADERGRELQDDRDAERSTRGPQGIEHDEHAGELYFKGLRLNAFQRDAVDAIQRGSSVLVSAPTGAGKTLVAEYAIYEALRQGKRCIYTAPIKALSNQKYRDFQQDPDIEVGLMTGDVTLDPHAPLLIMTTEIFRNTVFEDPDRVRDVEFLIFDEIHYLDDRDRGTVWEESLIFAPENIRMICLSATIQNLESFGDWIRSVRKQELEVIRSDKRPVPLTHMLYHGQYGGFDLKRLSHVQKKHRDEQRRWNDQGGGDRADYGAYRKRHPGRREGRGRSGNGAKGGRFDKRGRNDRDRRPHVHPHLAARKLLDELTRAKQTPILYFCFSRRECEIKAERNSHRRLLSPSERRKIARHFDKICDLFHLDWQIDPELGYLRDRALLGIGYHHAGMLPIHKEIVERLFTSGLLKLLFTTETFALGINMPARTVCFDALRKFDGVDFDYMKTRDYLQMAGRAGRQGIDDEAWSIACSITRT